MVHSTFNCQCERGGIHTKIVSICFKESLCISHCIYFVFRSVPFSVPRFINTRKYSDTRVIERPVGFLFFQHLICSTKESLLSNITPEN